MRRHPFLQFLRYLAITIVLVTPAGAFADNPSLVPTAVPLESEHPRATEHVARHDTAPAPARHGSL